MKSKNWLLNSLKILVLVISSVCFSANTEAHLFICHRFPWMISPYGTDYRDKTLLTLYPATYDKNKTAYLRFRMLPDLKECWLVSLADDCETDWSKGTYWTEGSNRPNIEPYDETHWNMDNFQNYPDLIVPDSITYNDTRIPVTGFKSAYNWVDKMYDEDPDPSVVLPSTLRFLYNSFNLAPDIESLVLPKNLKIIERSFRDVTRLKEIILPDSLECICYESFNRTYFETLTIPDNLKRIGNGCFNEMFNLETISIGNKLYEIGDHCFQHLEKVTHIILPENLDYIGAYCFNDIPDLTTLEIKNTSRAGIFSDVSFNLCPNITTIIVHSPQAYPALSKTSFVDVDFEKCVLIVPPGSEDSYRNASGWNRFKNIVADPAFVNHTIDDAQLEILPDKSIRINGIGDVEIYSADGKKVGKFNCYNSPITLPRGLYVYKKGNVCKKIML